MHKTRMIQKLKELNIGYISVYPHTEKVKLLDGSIVRLKDLSEATPSNNISLGEVTEITIESIPLEATPEELDQRQIETERLINKKSRKKDK